MKKILLLLAICMQIIDASAQNADIEVSYTAYSPNMKTGKDVVSNQYILLANTTESKFFSPKSEFIDSLNSTPSGKSKYQEMVKNAYFGGKMDQMVRKDGKYYVVKSIKNNVVKYYDNAGLNKFYYEEIPETFNWELSDERREFLGYECIKASTNFHGRRWTVWFTPEIPIQNGPWKFDNLPGLILYAISDGGQYIFEATGIKNTDKPVGVVYLADEYEKTTRKDLLKNQRAFLDNTLSRLNAQLSGIRILKVEDKDGNEISNSIFASRKTVDFLETDY